MQQALLSALGTAMRKTQPLPSGSVYPRAEVQTHTHRHYEDMAVVTDVGRDTDVVTHRDTDALMDVCVALDTEVVTIDVGVDKDTGLDMDSWSQTVMS